MEGAATNRVSYQWRIQEGACPPPPPPLFLDQTEARRSNFFLDRVPPHLSRHLSQGLDDQAPP